MATYSKADYTPKQLKVIFALVEEGKRLHARINFINRCMANKPYHEIQKLRKEKDSLTCTFKQVKKELNDVLEARNEYDKCIEVARENIERAEKLKEWGF